MIRLGLTGSIGMGKSTTANLFVEAGAVVYDADAAVHALYAPGGGGAGRLASLFPECVTADGAVDRGALSRRIKADPEALSMIEAAIHPLLTAAQAAFLAEAEAQGAAIAVLDIPLLYETQAEGGCDAVVVVTAPPEMQRERVLARPGMDAETLALLLAQQVPDADKRARADFVIDTGRGLEAARDQVRAVMATVTAPGRRG